MVKLLQVIEDDNKPVPVKYVLMSQQEFQTRMIDPFAGVIWDLKTVAKRLNRTPKWIKQEILYVPSLREILDVENGGPVTYSSGSGSNWRFEPHAWSKFVEDYYHAINWSAPEIR